MSIGVVIGEQSPWQIRRQIRRQALSSDCQHQAAQIADTHTRHVHPPQRHASRGVNDPSFHCQGHPPSRTPGRSHHGLLTDERRRGVQTGGTVRGPTAAMPMTRTADDWIYETMRVAAGAL
jgi:hypothetical protein